MEEITKLKPSNLDQLSLAEQTTATLRVPQQIKKIISIFATALSLAACTPQKSVVTTTKSTVHTQQPTDTEKEPPCEFPRGCYCQPVIGNNTEGFLVNSKGRIIINSPMRCQPDKDELNRKHDTCLQIEGSTTKLEVSQGRLNGKKCENEV
jgi:hypothetical protein